MDKDVCITLKSIQTVDDESDTTELFTEGILHRGREKDVYRLSYDESEATGFVGNTVTLDVIGSQQVTMIRKGNAASSLVIEKGKKHHCHYGTPYGDFMVGISADEIQSEINDNGGNIYLKYTIDINSSYMSENEMYISITERN